MGPLDRIVQAAGRCNREGKLLGFGKVVVFRPADGRQPRGPYKIGCDLAEAVLGRRRGDDLHDPDLYKEYFQRLFANADLDRNGIQELREDLDYPEVASRYRMIDETVPAIVSRPGSEAAFKRWQAGPSRAAWRGLQPYLVNFFPQQAREFVNDGYMEQVGKGLYRWLGRYDKVRGVMASAWDPADLIR
jgi:CRISPR-associated endonuclease/helicase Cas3